MSEALLTALITALGGIATAVITAYFGYKIERQRLELESRKIELERQKKNAKNKKAETEDKESAPPKDTVRKAQPPANWKSRFLMAFWKFRVLFALVLGGAITYFGLSISSRTPRIEPPENPNPAAANTPALIIADTPTATPSCPNAKVEYLELLISTGEWKQYYPDASGKIAPILSWDELGTLANLSGNASLTDAGDCLCAWKGSLQGAPFEPIKTSGDCGFSIDISSPSEKITRVNLELTIGNNQPMLFTISLP